MNSRNTLITVLVSVIVFALTVLVGLSVSNMTNVVPKEETGSTRQEGSGEPLDESESESESVGEESSSEAPAVPVRSDTLRVLTNEEIESIRSSRSGETKSYQCSAARNENGNPVDAVLFEARFREAFGDGVSVRNGSGRVSLTFVLTKEYDSNTTYLLNTLKEKDVRAVFYVDSEYALDNPGIIERIINEGHELGSIGYELPSTGFSSLTLNEQAHQLAELHSYVYERYGVPMDRFFYFDSNYTDQSIALLNASNYRVTFYTVNYADYSHDALIVASDFLTAMQERLHPGAIYSFHTTNTATLVVVPALIDHIRLSGYEIALPDDSSLLSD